MPQPVSNDKFLTKLGRMLAGRETPKPHPVAVTMKRLRPAGASKGTAPVVAGLGKLALADAPPPQFSVLVRAVCGTAKAATVVEGKRLASFHASYKNVWLASVPNERMDAAQKALEARRPRPRPSGGADRSAKRRG